MQLKGEHTSTTIAAHKSLWTSLADSDRDSAHTSMGQACTRTDFQWSYTEEPHATRRKEILSRSDNVVLFHGLLDDDREMATLLNSLY